MRTKIRITEDIGPGMVIRTSGDANYRQVASSVKHYLWAARTITFTDGTRETYALNWAFTVARGKEARNAVNARAAVIPSLALANAFTVFNAYAVAATGMRPAVVAPLEVGITL